MRCLGSQSRYYSLVRLWGSIGFILTVIVLGWLFDVFSIAILPWVLFLLLLTVLVACFTVPNIENNQPHDEHLPLKSILTDRNIIAFFIAIFLLQISHGAYYGFYSLFMEMHGYSKKTIGLLWAVGVTAEIILFFRCHDLLQRFSLRRCFLVSACAAVVRWILIGFFPENWVVAILVQALHAMTFGLVHAVSIEAIRRYFGRRHQGQGQAFYSAFGMGAGTALGTFCAGLFWGQSPVAIFIFAAAMSFLSWLIAYVAWKKVPDKVCA